MINNPKIDSIIVANNEPVNPNLERQLLSMLSCNADPARPELSTFIESLLAEDRPTIQNWELALVLYQHGNNEHNKQIQTEGTAEEIQKEIQERILKEHIFFEKILEDYYPFLNYLKRTHSAMYSLELISALENFYKGSFSDEGVYSLETLEYTILNLLKNHGKIYLTVDFDDTLNFGVNRGIPNFILINLLKRLGNKGVEFQILTSREAIGIPVIQEFIQKYFGVELKITHSKETDEEMRHEEKWRNLIEISEQISEQISKQISGYHVFHLDDGDEPKMGIQNSKIIWVKLPFISPDPDLTKAWAEFQKDQEVISNG